MPHQYQRSIFEIIVRDSIDLVVSDGEAIVSKAKKAIATSDFLSVMSVFCVIRHLAAVKPRVDRTLEVNNNLTCAQERTENSFDKGP